MKTATRPHRLKTVEVDGLERQVRSHLNAADAHAKEALACARQLFPEGASVSYKARSYYHTGQVAGVIEFANQIRVRICRDDDGKYVKVSWYMVCRSGGGVA